MTIKELQEKVNELEKLLNKIEFKRPTVAVRERPYVFLYQSRFERIEEQGGVAKPPLLIQPEGDVMQGSRVTWGFQIRVIKVDPTQPAIINFNGTQLTLPTGTNEYELINTIKNSSGVDKSQYTVYSALNDFYIHIIEQLMIQTPL